MARAESPLIHWDEEEDEEQRMEAMSCLEIESNRIPP